MKFGGALIFWLVFVMLAITESWYLLAWVPQWDAPRRRQTGPDGDGHDVVGDALLVVWTVHFTHRRKLHTGLWAASAVKERENFPTEITYQNIFQCNYLTSLFNWRSWIVWALLAQYYIIYNVKITKIFDHPLNLISGASLGLSALLYTLTFSS